MLFEQLSRQHAIKVAAGVNVSAEESRFAVGEVVGHERMFFSLQNKQLHCFYVVTNKPVFKLSSDTSLVICAFSNCCCCHHIF